mgnify:CR=1 FL=1
MKKIKTISICILLAAAFAVPLELLAQKATDAKMEAIANELKAAVKAGKLTEKQARAKWKAIQGSGVKKGYGKEDLEAIGKKLKAAVAAGKLTEKEAWAKWKAIQGGHHGSKKKVVDWDAIGRKIKAAVKAGKASKEEGEKRLAHLKEKLFGGSDKKDWDGKKGSDAGVEALKRELEALRRENEGLRKRLEKGKGR